MSAIHDLLPLLSRGGIVDDYVSSRAYRDSAIFIAAHPHQMFRTAVIDAASSKQHAVVKGSQEQPLQVCLLYCSMSRSILAFLHSCTLAHSSNVDDSHFHYSGYTT